MNGVQLFRRAAIAAGALGGISGAAFGLLNQQTRHARLVIGIPQNDPPWADGIYFPNGADAATTNEPPLSFAVLGDSMAAGIGVDRETELPGVLLAKGLAAETNRPVRLTTYAVSGATSKDLAGQVARALMSPPDVVLVIIGANDVTVRLSIRGSATRLAAAVDALVQAGAAVVVGTCPDLGAVRPIPQPLRAIASNWSLLLAKAQKEAVRHAGGTPVPLADLLSPDFVARPTELFSSDRYHPNATGYAAAAAVLLPYLRDAMHVEANYAVGLPTAE